MGRPGGFWVLTTFPAAVPSMPSPLEITRDDGLARVLLDRPPVNALTPDLLSSLRDAFGELATDDAVDGVLFGSTLDETFSGGLDLPAFAEAEPKVGEQAARDFLTLLDELYAYPKPIVAALPGDAVAGGILLPAAADVRIAARGDHEIKLNEIALGLPIPEPETLLIRELVGPREAHRALLKGKVYDPGVACDVGLVDRVVDPGALDETAEAKLEELAEKPQEAYRSIKRNLRAPLIDRMEAGREAAIAEAVELFGF
jgi:enoyl-CoA hydratase